jgi:hypothetical protein
MHPMPLRRLPLLVAVAAALVAAPGDAQESPFTTRACPVPAGMQGYPVWVKAADGTTLDSGYARALADAVARRWEPPSARRRTFPGLNRLRDRIQPPEPRWPDDWRPAQSHLAAVEITLRRGRRPGEARVTAPSGDRTFDGSVSALFTAPAPGAPELPALPAGADSVRVAVHFGSAPEDGAGVVRFAVQQSPVSVVPGTLNVARPQGPGATREPPAVTVKYDVDASGRIVPTSIDVLASEDRSMDQAIRAGLLRASFVPAHSDCRSVALSVVQVFGGR